VSRPWLVLVVEDDERLGQHVVETLREEARSPDGDSPTVERVSSFTEGRERLVRGDADVVVLDLRDEQTGDASAGEDVFTALKTTRFVPVVFFTALKERVADEANPPLVQVFGKDDSLSEVASAVSDAFSSGLPAAVRAIDDHVRETTREFLWSLVGPHWTRYAAKPADLAHLMIGRLAKSLEASLYEPGRPLLQAAWGAPLEEDVPSWHPSLLYIIPPMGEHPEFGDLLRMTDGQWWVNLTNPCDVEWGRADRLLLVSAIPLFDHPGFAEWRDKAKAWDEIKDDPAPAGGFSSEVSEHRRQVKAAAKDAQSACNEIIKGTKSPRWFYLPRLHNVPDLLIDFQHIFTPEKEYLADADRAATLAAPYAQAVATRLSGQIARVGLENVPADVIMERLRESPG
jgi:CheY-like chemotaxis protein